MLVAYCYHVSMVTGSIYDRIITVCAALGGAAPHSVSNFDGIVCTNDKYTIVKERIYIFLSILM